MQVQSRGFNINYVANGAGSALILVPGLTQSIASWTRAGYIDEFSPTHRVLAVDILGHGESDKPYDAAHYLTADMAEDVVAVLDAEGVDRAHVWGYSMGGAIAAMVASRFPERVDSLVVGGQHIAPVPAALWGSASESRRSQAEALSRGDWDKYFRLSGASDAAVQAVLKQGNDPRALGAALMGRHLSGNLNFDLSPLSLRILVYLGSEEVALKVPGALEMARTDWASLGARGEVLPGLGHASTFQARSTVSPLVREHLSALPPR